MQEMTLNQFQYKLAQNDEMVLSDQEPLRVIRKRGEDFIVMNAKNWAHYEETFYILQNPSLMKQIGESLKTHREGKGYIPDEEKLYALDSI